MGVYDRQIALATRLITKYGQLCTWQKPVDGIGGTPENPAVSTFDSYTDIPLVFLPERLNSFASILSMFPGSDVPTGGVKALMPAVAFVPELTDSVLRGAETLNVRDDNGIDVLNINGEPILYFVKFAR